MIAHELGHDRNGDARRGFVVRSAVDGLASLSGSLRPPQDASGHDGEMGLAFVDWATSV